MINLTLHLLSFLETVPLFLSVLHTRSLGLAIDSNEPGRSQSTHLEFGQAARYQVFRDCKLMNET